MIGYRPFSIFVSQSLPKSLVPESSSSTLYRDFVGDKQLNGPVSTFRIGPDISFIRNSNATFFNSACAIQIAQINEPRFDYAPNGQYLGLLIEEQNTNLVPYSQNFQLNWTPLAPGLTVTPNVPEILAPDNTQTATLILPSTQGNLQALTWGSTPFPFPGSGIDPEVYTRSIFVKKEKARYVIISCAPQVSALGGGGQPNYDTISNIFDLDTSTFTEFVQPIFDVERLKNGWFRISITRTSANVNTSNLTIGITNGPTFGDVGLTGTPGSLSGIYVWGGQVEKGFYPSSYIPTNGSQVIRAADNVSVNGSNFTTFYNVTAGTYATTARQTATLKFNAYATFINSNASKYMYIGSNETGDKHTFINSDTFNFIESPTINSKQFYRVSVGFIQDGFALYQDGARVPGSSSGSLPQPPLGLTRLDIGQFDGADYLNGHIQKINYIPARLPDSALSAI